MANYCHFSLSGWMAQHGQFIQFIYNLYIRAYKIHYIGLFLACGLLQKAESSWGPLSYFICL